MADRQGKPDDDEKHVIRTCRGCGRVYRVLTRTKACRACHSPYGRFVIGLDRIPGMPTAGFNAHPDKE